MERPEISIITVNLNNRQGLEKTIRSVAEQSFQALEHIVVDGLSSDGSRELLESLALPRLRWISEKDSGIYQAMNKGVRLAGGKYLLFLNSGDELADAGVLQRVFPFLDGKHDVVYGNLKFDDGSRITEGFMPDKIDLDHMMRDTLWHPASFIKKGLFTTAGGYSEDFRLCGDYEFFFRTLIAGKASSRHIPVFIAKFDLRGLTSDVRNHPLVKAEKQRVYSKYGEIVKQWKLRKPGLITRISSWFRS